MRALRNVAGEPFFIERAAGARIWDVDGKEYIDYVGSWGPAILGHAPKTVVDAVRDAAIRGLSFGIPNAFEVELAELICAWMPSIEKIRMVNSGTEAAMSALRLARGFTGRDKIIKFDGCYHGHADPLLVQAGSGALTHGRPDSAGVPKTFADLTISLPFNDIESLRKTFRENKSEIACVIVEPIPANAGLYFPKESFLSILRDECTKNGALLIFDEVITGFRVGYGGAQMLYGVTPDLTCLGKIIGGGLPVGAYGGPRAIMELIAPAGPVYQAGTLSGNPLAVTAGIETLKQLKKPGVYRLLEARATALAAGLGDAARKAGVPFTQTRVGSMLGGFFTKGPVVDYQTAKQADTRVYATFFNRMLEGGVYFAPSQFEAAFVSTAHTAADIEKTVRLASAAFKAL